jgi:hypothetical protein
MGRAWFAAGIALAVVGTALTVVVLGRGGGLSVLHVVLTPVVGWSFGLAGLVACLRPRWRRVGALMVAVGLAWFVHLLDWTHVPALEAATAQRVRGRVRAPAAGLPHRPARIEGDARAGRGRLRRRGRPASRGDHHRSHDLV